MTNDREEVIWAFDPGESTGWARGVIRDKALTIIDYGYGPWKRIVYDFYWWAQDNALDTVVYESWYLRPQNAKELVGSDMQSSQCIGALKLTAWVTQSYLTTSHPHHKPVIDRQMYENYLPTSDVEHSRDAIRHLCWFAVNKRKVHPSKITYREDDK